MKKAVGLNPIMTLIALTIGGKLAGFLGIFLAIPLALLLETILIELAQIRRL
jgi:predicted PurR-regulated permease PerM